MHPALKRAFETAYPPKHPDHKDLVEVNFDQFFNHCIGEETWAQLSIKIQDKITELALADDFQPTSKALNRRFNPPLIFPSSSHKVIQTAMRKKLTFSKTPGSNRRNGAQRRSTFSNGCLKSGRTFRQLSYGILQFQQKAWSRLDSDPCEA